MKGVRKITRTVRAQYERKLHVYGLPDVRGMPTGISVQVGAKDKTYQLRGGAAVIAWLPRGELRKVHTAIGKILGAKR